MDPLSDLFTSIRIQDAISTRLEATAPWGWESAAQESDRVTFVLVLRGSGILTMHGHPPVHLAGGDIFITLDGNPYTLADHPDSLLVDCRLVEGNRVDNVIQFGGGGAPTTFVSGSFAVDQLNAQPILSVLPGFLHFPLDQSRSHAFQSILELLAIEVQQPGMGSQVAIERLYELLFVHAIRAYASNGPLPDRGWLAAVSDKQLGKAARAMHAQLERDWTLQSLADCAAMSRSSFASRFKTVVGQAPLEYLTQWRMHRATVMIRGGRHALSEIAQAIGYDSESAFNRAFQRTIGTTPGKFRSRLAELN